jgi:hypothetical protein
MYLTAVTFLSHAILAETQLVVLLLLHGYSGSRLFVWCKVEPIEEQLQDYWQCVLTAFLH